MSSSNRTLPRWARVKKRESPRDFQTRTGFPYIVSVRSEELYLRTRFCVTTLQCVDRTVLKAFDENMGPPVKDLQEFFQSSSPWEQYSKSDTAKMRPRIDTSSDESDNDADDDDAILERLFTFEAPKQYSATLLPVAVLHGPLCSLDRHEFMRYLYDSLRKSRSAAVCWLRHASQEHSVGSLLREVLRQCLDQYESDGEKSAKILKDIDRNRSSVADALLQWAKSLEETCSPDSIVVLLENVDSSCTLFQDFLKRLSTLRSQHGLLICVVLCTSPTSASMPLQSSTQGFAGIHVQEKSFPESQKLYEKIWNHFLVFDPLPVSVPSGILRSIRESFIFQHGSLLRSVQLLKQALAQRFVRPGSFLGLDPTALVPDQERRRMKWFCLDEEARSYAFSNHASSSESLEQERKQVEEERRAYEVLLRVLREIMSEREVHENPSSAVVEMLEHSFSAKAYVKLRKELVRLFHKDSEENLLRLLRYREAFLWEQMSKGVKGLPPQLTDLYKRLHELIVLVDCNSQKTDERASSARAKQLVEMMDEWIYDVCRDASRLLSSGLGDEPISGRTSILPEPRRALARALLAHSEPSRDDRDITSLPSELFALIRDCVVISRDEWFRRFWLRSMGDEETPQELWPQFAFGVYQLELLGLIQEKSGSTRSERVYEKTALVWCSGE